MPIFGDQRVHQKVKDLIANDGTLLPALPPMAWALWQQKLRKGACYVNDRNYSQDYRLIGRVQKAQASFVLRLPNHALVTPLDAPRVLSAADLQAGVVADRRVRLGSQPDGPVGRLVRVQSHGHTFLLFTNLHELEAPLMALIDRYRWQIQLFFKWLKGILDCRHWFAQSPQGLTLEVDGALIASVLLVLWTGQRPTKRQWEALQLYGMGWVSLEALRRVMVLRKKN